jgi:hypothetical protein
VGIGGVTLASGAVVALLMNSKGDARSLSPLS